MEVEIKAKCSEQDFPLLRKKLVEMGAVKNKEKRQLDQYYNLPHTDLRGTKRYIRVRNEAGNVVLAFHENLSQALTKELEVKVSDAKTLEEILERFGLKKLGLIDKFRETFKLNEFEVCLDKVAGIGTYVEIETDGDESNAEAKQKECMDLLKKLGLSEKTLTNEFLCDVATKK